MNIIKSVYPFTIRVCHRKKPEEPAALLVTSPHYDILTPRDFKGKTMDDKLLYNSNYKFYSLKLMTEKFDTAHLLQTNQI